MLVESTLRDLRFGLRMLRRSPGFSLLAILCLTVGIGANAAVFSWFEGILLRPFPAVAHQDRMMAITGIIRTAQDRDDVSWPDFVDLQRRATLFDALIAEKIVSATLSLGDRAERVRGSVVSSNYFEALGLHPILGRGFEPADELGRNAHPVTVISYQFWQERYHGDRGVIGETQLLNAVPHTIIGVAPPGFYGTFVGYSWMFWVPISMQETFEPGGYKLEDRGARWIEGFAMRKGGVTAEQAQQEISAIARQLEAEYPEIDRGRGIKLYPLWATPFNNAGALLPTLGVALAVVVFILLIACANVGNLLLVRAFTRRHEMTVRLALGAGRGRLLSQLLVEGLVLAAVSALGGLLFAYGCRNALVRLIPWRGVPMFLPGAMDWRVIALSGGVCILSTLLFGLVPALQVSKVDLAGALKTESGSVVGGRGKAWIRSGLVLLQVSLSFVLVVGAVLVVRSLTAIQSSSPGFRTQGLVVTALRLPVAAYDEARARNFQDQLMERVAAMNGVESAAYTRILPFSYSGYSSAPIAVDTYHPRPDEQPTASYDEVGPGYFATMGIPLVEGREFTRADDQNAPPVAVVNEAMAAQYWRGQDPLGSRVEVKGRWMQVVGVARTVKYNNFLETAQPFFYVPLRQNFSSSVGLLIRTPQNAVTMAPALAREVHALDPDLSFFEVISMRENLDRSTGPQRIALTLLGGFGGLALALAAIGLYGVMSYAVSQSRRELGLRMALGAGASDLLRLVLSKGLELTAAGVALGAAAAFMLTRLMGYLLYQVSPRDPLAFGSALVLMTLASLAACFLPAWHAARTDPVCALKE